MPDKPNSRDLLLQALNQAGWTLVAERVIRGICHDLNGRINTLSSLAFLSPSEEGRSPAESGMQDELRAMEESVRQLRLLPDDGGGRQLLAPGEILPSLGTLARLQPGLEGVSIRTDLSPQVPALRADPVLLQRIVVLLLTAAGEEALAGGEKTVYLSWSGEGSGFTIRPGRNPEVEDGESAEAPDRSSGLPRKMEGLVAEVLREMGGELAISESSEGDTAFELRLPTP